jgi:ribose transport system permease protein
VSKLSFRFRITHELVLLGILGVLFVGFGLIEPAFFRPRVFLDIFNIMGEVGVMALAMTYIISTSGVDLAVGYELQLSAVIFGMVWIATENIVLASGMALVAGAAAGAFNGLVISRTKIPPLVTTLATMYLFRGVSMILIGSAVFTGFPQEFRLLSTYRVFGVLPVQALYLVGLFAVLNFFYERGSLGRNLKAMGFNEKAVIFSGINVKRIKMGIYTLTGLLCGLAALIYVGRLAAVRSSIGDDLNFKVITAVLLGGTSIMGGVGSMKGTFIAVLIIGVLQKGFTLLNFSGNIFNFTIGMLLILSLIAFSITERRTAGKKASAVESIAIDEAPSVGS